MSSYIQEAGAARRARAAKAKNKRSRAYDFLYKILVLGDAGTGKHRARRWYEWRWVVPTCLNRVFTDLLASGKSNLLLKYTDNVFSEHFISTIGVDFKFHNIAVPRSGGPDRQVKMQIWDTAGCVLHRATPFACFLKLSVSCAAKNVSVPLCVPSTARRMVLCWSMISQTAIPSSP